MAVTKTSLVSVLAVLAITYNQGAARPMYEEQSDLTQNELTSSEETGPFKTYVLPTAIEKGLVITINGTIDKDDNRFVVELPSISGKESCKIQLDYTERKKHLYISPALEGTSDSEEYDLKLSSEDESREILPFSLMIVPRVDKQNNDLGMGMTFITEAIGPSTQLICKTEDFNDINQIVIKSGVDSVDTLLFEFFD